MNQARPKLNLTLSFGKHGDARDTRKIVALLKTQKYDIFIDEASNMSETDRRKCVSDTNALSARLAALLHSRGAQPVSGIEYHDGLLEGLSVSPQTKYYIAEGYSQEEKRSREALMQDADRSLGRVFVLALNPCGITRPSDALQEVSLLLRAKSALIRSGNEAIARGILRLPSEAGELLGITDETITALGRFGSNHYALKSVLESSGLDVDVQEDDQSRTYYSDAIIKMSEPGAAEHVPKSAELTAVLFSILCPDVKPLDDHLVQRRIYERLGADVGFMNLLNILAYKANTFERLQAHLLMIASS